MKYQLLFTCIVSLFTSTLYASPIFSSADSSLAGGSTITFDDLALGNYSSINTGGVSFSNAAPAITPAIQGISIQDAGAGNQYLRYSTSIFPASESSASAVPLVSLRFDFSAPINAFALSVSGSYPYSLQAYDAANNLIETFGPTAGSYSHYIMGISSTTSISYAILGNVNGFDYLEIDDFKIGPSAVPVPTGLPLLISGLAFFGLARRRRSYNY